jgi:hypothetical protein
VSEHTDALAALRQLDDESLTCRRGSGVGHAWRVLGYWQHGTETRRTLVCQRCGSERVDRWERTSGERHPGTYRYAEGYQLPEQPQAWEVRIECMRRAKTYPSEEAMIAALTEGVGRKRSER